MGMYDRIHCQYDAGVGFYNRTLQTKDLYSAMDEYWIDPSGKLYHIDYSGTQDWEPNDKWGFTPVSNGNRGKIKPILHCGSILVYPENWDSKYAPFPSKILIFKYGIIDSMFDPPKRHFY